MIDVYRVDGDQQDLVGERREHDIGKQVIDEGHAVFDRPIRFWAVAQSLDVLIGEGDSTVRAEGFDDVEVVVLNRIERVLVRRADVVALEELLDQNLPIHRPRSGVDADQPFEGQQLVAPSAAVRQGFHRGIGPPAMRIC